MQLGAHGRWFGSTGRVVVQLALPLILAACGGGSTTPTTQATPTGQAAADGQMAAMVRALGHQRELRIGADLLAVRSALGKGTLMTSMMGGTEQIFGFFPCDASTDAISVTMAEGRVAAILVTPCSGAGGMVRSQMARRLLPSDATPVGTLATPGPGGTVSIYRSAMLPRALDDYWFEDCSGNKVAPGTVAVAPLASGGWDITVGTCPNAGV